MKTKQVFTEAIIKKFPKIADDLSHFVNNPMQIDPALVKVKAGVKFGFPYYITYACNPDMATLHNIIPILQDTEIAHILMTATEYAFFTKRKDIQGIPLQAVMPPDGHTHIMVAFGFNYRTHEKKPFSLMKNIRKFTRRARKKLIREGL